MPGLTCREGEVCVDNTGYLGGLCFAGGTCNRGLRCQGEVCVPCLLGSIDCNCNDMGECNPGLECSGGRCLDDSVLGPPPPEDPQCYTPCQGNLPLPDGSQRLCPADGLMPGCVDPLVCQSGTCALPGQGPLRCQTQLDCPHFQTCRRGHCYAECETDLDCDDSSCHRKVCRTICATSGSGCDDGFSCVAEDGEYGHCQPVAAPAEGPPQRAVAASFSLNKAAIELSNVSTTARIAITNSSSGTETFLVRKRSHEVLFEDGNVDRRDDQNDGIPCDVVAGECPLWWLGLGLPDDTAQVQELDLQIQPNGVGFVEIAMSSDIAATRWSGRLEVLHPTLGEQSVSIGFRKRPDGQWTGTMYTFAQFGDRELDAWRAGGPVSQVGNALIRRWVAFKSAMIGWDELLAVLMATRTESWRWPNVAADCPATEGACYMYDINQLGLVVYTSDIESAPIPTGVVELPFSVNLWQTDADLDPAAMQGRIVSEEALHYAGHPALSVRFAHDPADCTSRSDGSCVTFLEEFSADILLGGRFETDATNTACSGREGYQLRQEPWLVPGFSRATEPDAASGVAYRYTCRDSLLPFNSGSGDLPDALVAANLRLAAANPIPDGRARRRSLRLIDGAMVNDSMLFVLFEESFSSFLPIDDPTAFRSYGYMLLTRQAAGIDPADANNNQIPDSVEGSVQQDNRDEPHDLLEVSCSADLVEQVLGIGNRSVGADEADRVATALIEGVSPGAATELIDSTSDEVVHYLCADTGRFDSVAALPCPAGSAVRFFTVDRRVISNAEIEEHACQDDGSCEQVLLTWLAIPGRIVQDAPVWRCSDPAMVYCDTHRDDLRDGKEFFAAGEDRALFPSLYAEIELAFRYKTRFRSASGDTPGFAPEICIPNSNQIPYCYDPSAIEAIRDRVDCLLHVWQTHYDTLAAGAKLKLDRYLCTNFAYAEACHGGDGVVHDGFERLYTELLVMMGDEAYTRAFASRFELAGSSAVSFEGAQFEPGGINLSGAAGYELHSLYQAVQYYQEALDRFYAASPLVAAALETPYEDKNFVTAETATWYLERLVGASTQKSRALSQIARRYQSFNRADLARGTVERAYTATFLEAVVLARMMLRITDVLRPEDRPQVAQVLEEGQRRYRMAMLDMRNIYDAINDNITFFGLPPDYIPFPTLGPNEQNAFEVIISRAQAKMAIAREREDEALSRGRSFETNAQEFQAELVRLRNTYEGQLGDICGTFQGSDGRIYPAIERYAYLDEVAAKLGDPCGSVGNGSIHATMGQVEVSRLDLERILVSYTNVFEEIEIEQNRVAEQCQQIADLADYVYTKQGEMRSLQSDINDARFVINRTERSAATLTTLAEMNKCTIGFSTDCPAAAVASLVIAGVAAAAEAVVSVQEREIAGLESDIANIERKTARWQTLAECDVAQIDGNARMATMLLRLKEIQLEALRADYQTRLHLADMQRLSNQAKRLEQELAEAEQYAINIEAARNDPNVRIYRNDAYLNADLAFEDALREAYRATKVFEYYASQTYAGIEQLFLIRMVQFGDYNLENYLTDLQNAFFEFEETYGLPDTRVAILSVRDDILGIPRLDLAGNSLSQSERIDVFRQRLSDPSMLDSSGYLTVPFPTSFSGLSPLTRNHKILAVEAEIIGSDVGDRIGRIYLRQRGTSVVHGLTGEKSFYRFPERTAVVNPFFNGSRVFDAEVYRNQRLRDRPFINTSWDLVLNQRDELANQDIDLQSLTDVRIYVYYSDFTEL